MINYEESGIEITNQSIGEGGSAIVHEGITIRDDVFGLEMGTRLAVKEFKPSLLEVPNQKERIKQEANFGISIKHDRLVQTYGLIESKNGEFALIMEYVDGINLSQWSSKQRKGASWTKWQQVAIDICDGVNALHNKGVLHRDIKPENIFIVNDRAKVMDVGIACYADPNEHTMHTQVKDFIGSIRYASPQFIDGEVYDIKDDIYMIGVTLLETFTGRRPYHEIERKVVIPIHMQNPPKFGSLREKIPVQIKILLEGCINRNRDRRPDIDVLIKTLKKPEGSTYIQQEVSRQKSDEKEYPILKITRGDGGFYADIGTDFDTDIGYVVVRREEKIHVPSLGITVEPEMWIADVELRHHKHKHHVGHFKLIGKRWVEGERSNFLRAIQAFSSSTGSWVEYDKKDEKVRIGDIVVPIPVADFMP